MARNRGNRKKPLAVRIIQLVCCLFFGILLMVLAPKSAAQHNTYEERCTAQVTGTVTDTRTETTKVRKHNSKMKTNQTDYYFTVTYTVDGRSYSKEKQIAVQKYSKNDTIVVHYAPDDPSFGYIEGYMPQDQQKTMTIIGIVVIVLGILFFFIS